MSEDLREFLVQCEEVLGIWSRYLKEAIDGCDAGDFDLKDCREGFTGACEELRKYSEAAALWLDALEDLENTKNEEAGS